MSDELKTLLKALLRDVPGVRWLRRRRHERAFRSSRNWRFWGVFETRDDACRAAREAGKDIIGYDTPVVAPCGKDLYGTFHEFDYPALLWILRFHRYWSDSNSGRQFSVADLGGHFGEKAALFQRFWPPLKAVEWSICETPSVVAAVEAEGFEALPGGTKISSDREILNGADLLFASGVIQYLDYHLPELLGSLDAPPQHLILNKLPLSAAPDHWTIQNVGRTVVPYLIQNETRFLDALRDCGYRLLDRWPVEKYFARIPFHPHRGTSRNVGLALSRQEEFPEFSSPAP